MYTERLRKITKTLWQNYRSLSRSFRNTAQVRWPQCWGVQWCDVIWRVCLKWSRLVGHSCGQVLTARPRVAPTWAQQTVRSAPHCRHVFWCSTALQALQAPLAVLPQFRTLAPASRLLSRAQRFPDCVRREFCQGFWGSTPTKKLSNCMENSPCRKPDSRLVSHEILRLL